MVVIEKAKVTMIDGEYGLIGSITIQPKDGELIDVPADHVLVFFGLAPKLGPIAEWGLDINRMTTNVDTENLKLLSRESMRSATSASIPERKNSSCVGFTKQHWRLLRSSKE